MKRWTKASSDLWRNVGEVGGNGVLRAKGTNVDAAVPAKTMAGVGGRRKQRRTPPAPTTPPLVSPRLQALAWVSVSLAMVALFGLWPPRGGATADLTLPFM